MEAESLHREVTKLKTEKAALQVKSRLFENFAAMGPHLLPSAFHRRVGVAEKHITEYPGFFYRYEI